MSIINPLSHEFLVHKTAKAAAVIQTLNADQAALYLSNVPIRVLVPVMELIESWPAARILERMPPDQASAVLSQMKYPIATALMRLLDDDLRQSLLAQLPKQLVRTLARSLRYAEDTVGAWMDSSTPHFSPQLPVNDCLGILKNSGLSCEFIVVANNEHRIEGVVPLSTLLTASALRPLGELVDRQCEALSAQSSLQMAKGATGWRRYSVLPVRSGSGAFIGTLSREALFNALTTTLPTPAAVPGNSLIAHLSRAMLTTLSGLLNMTVNNLSTATNNQQEKRDDLNR